MGPMLVTHTTNDSVQWLETQYASFGVADLDHASVLTGIYAD